MKHIVLCGCIYFMAVFFAGFILGIMRVLLLEPVLGDRWSEIIEAPLMIVVIFSVSFYIHHHMLIKKSLDAFLVGAIAITLMLAAETIVMLHVRKLTWQQYFETRDPIAGIIYAILLIIFTICPLITSVCHRSSHSKSGT